MSEIIEVQEKLEKLKQERDVYVAAKESAEDLIADINETINREKNRLKLLKEREEEEQELSGQDKPEVAFLENGPFTPVIAMKLGSGYGDVGAAYISVTKRDDGFFKPVKEADVVSAGVVIPLKEFQNLVWEHRTAKSSFAVDKAAGDLIDRCKVLGVFDA